MTPLLYAPDKLIASGQTLNNHFFSYLLKRITFSFDYLLWDLTQDDTSGKFTFSNYGISGKNAMQEKDFPKNPEIQVQSAGAAKKESVLNKLKSQIIIINNVKNEFISRCRDAYPNTLSQHNFLLQIVSESKKKGHNVSGVHIPMLQSVFVKTSANTVSYFADTEVKIYSLPDFQFLNAYFYWADQGHLSSKGASCFTNQVIKSKILEAQNDDN